MIRPERTDTNHLAVLRWIDAGGQVREERHVSNSVRRATTWAYRRAKSMMITGEARCWRIVHGEERVIQ